MLLTQSQVSVFVTSGVVVFFTALLFLSGYIIQQRTVVSLQQSIKPHLPQPPSSLAISQGDKGHSLQSDLSSRFFRRDGSHIAYLDFERSRHISEKVNWQRLAHVQLARNHHDVCNAVMILADLHRLKSPARRVLLFPQSWVAEKEPNKDEPKDPFMDSTRRLMRLAARRYGVELCPISPWSTHNVSSAEPLSSSTASEDTFSLATAFALTDFDRVLSVATPGLIMDASPLDAALAFTESAPLAVLQDGADGEGIRAEDLLLLHPSGVIHSELLQLADETPSLNDTALISAFTDPLLLDSSSSSSALVRSIGTLHQHAAGSDFNRTAFLTDVAYLRFSDPKLPGPEYDVPWSEKVAARPKNQNADFAWTKLYGTFAQRRMEICGLDLESWRP